MDPVVNHLPEVEQRVELLLQGRVLLALGVLGPQQADVFGHHVPEKLAVKVVARTWVTFSDLQPLL